MINTRVFVLSLSLSVLCVCVCTRARMHVLVCGSEDSLGIVLTSYLI